MDLVNMSFDFVFAKFSTLEFNKKKCVPQSRILLDFFFLEPAPNVWKPNSRSKHVKNKSTCLFLICSLGLSDSKAQAILQSYASHCKNQLGSFLLNGFESFLNFSEGQGHTFVLLFCWFCHNSERFHPFWTIFGHSEALESL